MICCYMIAVAFRNMSFIINLARWQMTINEIKSQVNLQREGQAMRAEQETDSLDDNNMKEEDIVDETY